MDRQSHPLRSARAPHPVDVAVGRNLRLLRHRHRISQTRLAKALDLTFQQVQKYENGSNRISASKLYEAAQVLGVNVEDIFAGLPRQGEPPVADAAPDSLGAQPEIISDGDELVHAFGRLASAKARRRAVRLIQQLAFTEGNDEHEQD